MDALQDEVESLEAIMMDDVIISRNAQSDYPELIETTVFSNVGDESEQQYVCVTLQVLPTPGYPDSASPNFKLLRPRGLDDTRLEAIRAACTAKLQESLGFPVVFDLIEVVREHLTDTGNLPSGQCVICLYGFSDGDEFTRSECFHYLHSYCLGRHLTAARKNYQEEYDKLPAWQQKTAAPFQAVCPVCREPIKDDAEDSLKCAMPPAELENAPEFRLTRELRELQQRMSSLFQQQKSRGAIIDIEAESGAVIAIETEEDLRRRRRQKQKKQNGAGAEAAVVDGIAAALDAIDLEEGEAEEDEEIGGTSTGAEQKHTSKAAGSVTTAFAPVIQLTQRFSADPTNNNYQHNRRHFRGGRRHHRERPDRRDRERYENHHHSHTNSAGSSSGGGASSSANAAPPPTSSSSSNNSGKLPKAQAASGTHSR